MMDKTCPEIDNIRGYERMLTSLKNLITYFNPYIASQITKVGTIFRMNDSGF